jgi:hypothetical protein
MFLITDSYGTRRTAWTRAAALEWLAVCSPEAKIVHRLTGRTLAARTFARAY